jgi:hypothetical protein
MARPLAFICATLALFLALPVHADAELDGFARDVERVEGVRAVKTLQSSYAQYAQYGLWNEVGAFFARNGQLRLRGDDQARGDRQRPQIQNILATNEWTSQYTPGFFQWPAPRTVFAYITTDLQ